MSHNTGKRRRRRRRHINKALRKAERELLETFDALAHKEEPPPAVIIPLIRKVMPKVIASQIVGEQPMMSDPFDEIDEKYHDALRKMLRGIHGRK